MKDLPDKVVLLLAGLLLVASVVLFFCIPVHGQAGIPDPPPSSDLTCDQIQAHAQRMVWLIWEQHLAPEMIHYESWEDEEERAELVAMLEWAARDPSGLMGWVASCRPAVRT